MAYLTLRPSIRAACAVCLALSAAGPAPAQTGAPSGAASLLDRAEALSEAETDAILEQAFAHVGCTIPGDLVSVFDIYLVDQVMAYLGEPVGPEVARQAFFGLRLRSSTIHHPQARAVLAAARAVEGDLAASIREGRLTLYRGLFEVADCVPDGTVFVLAPYAEQ